MMELVFIVSEGGEGCRDRVFCEEVSGWGQEGGLGGNYYGYAHALRRWKMLPLSVRCGSSFQEPNPLVLPR